MLSSDFGPLIVPTEEVRVCWACGKEPVRLLGSCNEENPFSACTIKCLDALKRAWITASTSHSDNTGRLAKMKTLQSRHRDIQRDEVEDGEATPLDDATSDTSDTAVQPPVQKLHRSDVVKVASTGVTSRSTESGPGGSRDAHGGRPSRRDAEFNAGQSDGQPFKQGQTYESRGAAETYRIGSFYRAINKGPGRMQAKGYVRTRTAVSNSESPRLCVPEDKTILGPVNRFDVDYNGVSVYVPTRRMCPTSFDTMMWVRVATFWNKEQRATHVQYAEPCSESGDVLNMKVSRNAGTPVRMQPPAAVRGRQIEDAGRRPDDGQDSGRSRSSEHRGRGWGNSWWDNASGWR